MEIIHRNGDLFNAPPEAMLAHACNCKGLWRSGIAAQFKVRFPDDHIEYERLCYLHGSSLRGQAVLLAGRVVALFTSVGYGQYVDPPASILEATRSAIRSLDSQLPRQVEVHSPRINAGLFKVPWEQTEAVIKGIDSTRTWVVWTP